MFVLQTYWPFVCLFGEMFIQIFCPFLIELLDFCCFEQYSFFLFVILSYLVFAIELNSLYNLDINPFRYMVCENFLPFSRLSLYFVGHFLCCAEAFDEIPLVYFQFFFYCLCCCSHIKNMPRIMSKIFFSRFSSNSFKSEVQVFNPL